MSPAATPQPILPPSDPCLKCVQHVEHDVLGHGVVTDDPIMAAIGMWFRAKDDLMLADAEAKLGKE